MVTGYSILPLKIAYFSTIKLVNFRQLYPFKCRFLGLIGNAIYKYHLKWTLRLTLKLLKKLCYPYLTPEYMVGSNSFMKYPILTIFMKEKQTNAATLE